MTKSVGERLIFQITHMDNLPGILADGCLWADDAVRKTKNRRTVIGFDTIRAAKSR